MKIPETTGLRVKESAKADLLTAAKWTKFLCIVGSIGIALIVIFAIFLFGAGTVASSMFSEMPFGAVAMGIIYLVIAALYIYPIMKGFQFASGAKAACLSDDENELARGIKGLSSLTQFTAYRHNKGRFQWVATHPKPFFVLFPNIFYSNGYFFISGLNNG